MKIGSSFSRCIPDMVNGLVSLDDVALIISSTCFTNDEGTERQAQELVEYHIYYPRWRGLDKEQCLEVVRDILDMGKLYQPRLEGSGNTIANGPIWFDLLPTTATDHPMVKDAWHQYMVALTLSGQILVPETPNYP
jgi:hypothetical protein